MFRVEIVEKKTIEKLEKAVNNILISKGDKVQTVLLRSLKIKRALSELQIS
ncbi:hypothetical protein [Enterococcus faecium]|uniref:hypothetical protein n=1 Tax=Enterococcus faecium TaxID=1352 RepID=UPI0002A3612E|nr:hypothetical protein [Enterococcus faecium]ELB18041.1 hypothetical protein OIS_05177 [Enterococcus faecium EnGen0035]